MVYLKWNQTFSHKHVNLIIRKVADICFSKESWKRMNTVCNVFHQNTPLRLLSNLNLKKKLNFNQLLRETKLETFQVCTKHVRLEQISSYIPLFETFESKRLFIWNHHYNNKGLFLLTPYVVLDTTLSRLFYLF